MLGKGLTLFSNTIGPLQTQAANWIGDQGQKMEDKRKRKAAARDDGDDAEWGRGYKNAVATYQSMGSDDRLGLMGFRMARR